MKKLLILIAIFASVLGGSGGVALAADGPTQAAKDAVCSGVTAGQPGADCSGTGGQQTITKVLNAVLAIISWIAGIAAIIMIVLAGLKYITSGGDSSQVASAKTSLVYALVGLVIAAIAQLLVHFVISTAKA